MRNALFGEKFWKDFTKTAWTFDKATKSEIFSSQVNLRYTKCRDESSLLWVNYRAIEYALHFGQIPMVSAPLLGLGALGCTQNCVRNIECQVHTGEQLLAEHAS